MIRVDQLSKSFGDIHAVRRVSFIVERSEVLGFLGRNGAGKTTTMRIIAGFLPADRGTVEVCGHDVERDPLGARRCLGYLPEKSPLYPEMRVEEFLRFRCFLKEVRRRERESRIGTVLERCGISDVRRRIIGTLSKGYQKRVGLADALVHEPQVVVLDEPTEGLDPDQARQVRALIRELGRERTVLLSSHILADVEGTCDAVMIMHEGMIAARDTPANLRRRMERGARIRAEIAAPPEEIRAAFGADPRVLEIVVGKPEDGYTLCEIRPEATSDLREAVFRESVRRGWTLRELVREWPTLEEIFIEITARPPEGSKERG